MRQVADAIAAPIIVLSIVRGWSDNGADRGSLAALRRVAKTDS